MQTHTYKNCMGFCMDITYITYIYVWIIQVKTHHELGNPSNLQAIKNLNKWNRLYKVIEKHHDSVLQHEWTQT